MATSYPELNFIVEHVGLPRIEDFCFMATQEPNVYAGLAVVIGGLMHARPRFFAKVMGELLFWVGEDKMLFGADYAHLGAQVAGRGPGRLGLPGRDVLRLPGVHDGVEEEDPRAQRRQAVRRRGARRSCRLPDEAGTPAARDDAAAGRGRRVMNRAHVLDALGTVYDPELDEPITTLRFVSSCEVSADGDVDVRLRLPTPQCAPNFAYLMAADARDAVRRLPEVARGHGRARGPLHGRRDQRRGRRAARRSRDAFPGETEGELDALRELFQRKALVARQSRLCEALLAAGATPEEVTAQRVADLPDEPGRAPLHRAARAPRHPRARRRPAFVLPDGEPIAAADLRHWLRVARLVRTSLEANGGICRSLLRIRYELPDAEEVAA